MLSRKDMVGYLEAGCKPKADWRIGTEHEKVPFHIGSGDPVAYDGASGIGAILDGLTRFGYEPIKEGETTIGLDNGSANISLEPGGQFELSGAPLRDLHATCQEVHTHLAQVKEVCDELGVGMLGLGFRPISTRDDVPWMPKGRYKIMREYMPKVGTRGLDMMLRSCTVQVNLDFSSEQDMARKMRVSTALQPIATALFANSPFLDGKPSGYLSYRNYVWQDTDNDRAGLLPFVFDDGFGFERYVDYALSVPMYFAYRKGTYHDFSGQSFVDFNKGQLDQSKTGEVTLKDWEDHLTTLFPEVRTKRFIEMRGADAGPWHSLCALPALWVGLLYDDAALDAAYDLIADWTYDEVAAMALQVPKLALKTPWRNDTIHDVAKEVLAIANEGLKRRNIMSASGLDERQYLDSINEIAESGITLAERHLQDYEGSWNGDVSKIFESSAY